MPIRIVTVLCAGVLAGFGQTPASTDTANQGFRVRAGGIDVTLPTPEGDFVEVGDRVRTTVFDLMTPSSNRLLAAYISHEDQRNLLAGTAKGGLPMYAMVEVLRGAEYTDVTPASFEEILKSITTSPGEAVDRVADLSSDELNARMKVLGGKPITVDHPEMLGTLFHSTDAFGSGMLVGMKGGDSQAAVTMAVVTVLVRVKQRVLIAYLYQKYDSAEIVESLKKVADAWASRILSANQ